MNNIYKYLPAVILTYFSASLGAALEKPLPAISQGTAKAIVKPSMPDIAFAQPGFGMQAQMQMQAMKYMGALADLEFLLEKYNNDISKIKDDEQFLKIKPVLAELMQVIRTQGPEAIDFLEKFALPQYKAQFNELLKMVDEAKLAQLVNPELIKKALRPFFDSIYDTLKEASKTGQTILGEIVKNDKLAQLLEE